MSGIFQSGWHNPEGLPSEIDREKDKMYDAKKNTSSEETKKIQEEARKSLYWSFSQSPSEIEQKPNTKDPNSQETKNKQNILETKEAQISFSKEAKDSKEFPVLERLQKDGKISEWALNSLFKDYKKDSKIDTSKIENKEEKKIIDWIINNFKEREKPINEQKDTWNNEDFKKDIEKFEEFKILNEAKDQKWTIEADIYSMMSKNYFKINTEISDNKEIKQNFEVSIKISLNNIKDDYKTLNQDTETFKQAEQKINSGDLKKSLEWLQTIYLLASWTAAISNAKTKEQADAIKAKLSPEMKKEIIKIQEQVKTKEEQVKQEQDPKKNENLEQEIISLKKQEWEISSWEVFKSAKEDNLKNNTDTQNSTSQQTQSPQTEKK